MALERVEQAEELTYEVVDLFVRLFSPRIALTSSFVSSLQRLLALESNMFSGRLSFYDQHGDMRLDIDSMSYEVCYSSLIC